MPNFTAARLPLYAALWVFSLVLVGLTATRLNFTDTLGFYEPIVAELLACGILALLFAPFVSRFVHQLSKHRMLSYRPQMVEFVALSILWLLWIVGCAYATTIWPDLSGCQSFPECQLLSAMLAFAWLGWTTITVLLITEAAPYIRIKKHRR